MDRVSSIVVSGGTIVPMAVDGEFFSADLTIQDREIAAIGEPITPVDHDVLRLDASEALVLPGFVQCHVHVVQSLLRHQADGLTLLDWLRTRNWPFEAALNPDGVYAAAELGIAELVCGGTTTALDFGTTHHHDRVFEAADELGIRFVSGMTHMDEGDGVPRGLIRDADDSLAEASAVGDRWHGAAEGRLAYSVAPRFALSCSTGLMEAAATLARSKGWSLQTHASENRDEIAEVRRRFGRSNIEYLNDCGLTGEDVVLAHGVHLTPAEIDLLARTGTNICHCPGANFKLASGIADLVSMLDAGITVGLGADGPPCNNRLSVFSEMSLAGTIHGLRSGPTAVDAWKVLAMATRDGARALGLDGRIGTLEIGKRADLVVIDVNDWSMLPAGNPASRVVHGAGIHSVRHVVIDGRPIVVDGKLQSARPENIREHVRSAWSATRARMEV